MERYKKYIIGSIMILFQYVLFRYLSNFFKVSISMRNVISFLYVFLYLKEDIYSFKTYLIWEELKKQLKCYMEYSVIVSIIVIHINIGYDLWKYLLIGSIMLIYSIFLAKIIRIILVRVLEKKLVIVGVGEVACSLGNIVHKNKFTMYNFLGYIDVGKDKEVLVDRKMIISANISMKEFIKKNKVTEVIVALPNIKNKELNVIVDQFESYVKKIKIIPEINKMYTFNSEIQDYDGMLLISVKNNILSQKRRIIKRIFDIIGSSVGIMVLGVLYLKYSIKIKSDGGSVLYSHIRKGFGLKDFKMYKFRTMVENSDYELQKMFQNDKILECEFYKNFKLRDDPRITKIGKYLRKTSLDEFPQFINVLKGDMSLVGPRPVVQKEVELYYGTEMAKKIFQVKPGITGMWQANGRSDIEDYEERIALDLYYIRNWSLWLDIIIIIKTIKYVLQRKGAY